MRRWPHVLRVLLALGAWLPCLTTGAGDEAAPSFAVRAGRIMPVSDEHPWVIENGVLIVRDGRIEAIGADLDIPPDLQVLHLPDATIVPGFVAAQSGLGGTHTGDHSVSGAYRAIDSFDRYGEFEAALAGGITTAHLDPGWHRLVSGRGAIVRLGGYHDARILSTDSDLTINLGPAAFNPPDLVTVLVPPSGDRAITPARPQRPTTRLGQYQALREALSGPIPDDVAFHVNALRSAWDQRVPLRIQAQRAVDIRGAVAFLRANDRPGYLVGGLEAAKALDQLRDSGVPLVYTIDHPGSTQNLGRAAIEPQLADLAELDGIKLALGVRPGQAVAGLRLAAATALRAGLSPEQVLAAITRTPAEILGISDRVGSLAPGRDADFLVMSGDPLDTSSHVNRAYIEGRLVHRSDRGGGALVIRGGTIWRGPNDWLENGSILIEDGSIVAVGKSVPHPPGARVVDAGPEAFITPGLIDAHGHLGLEGDRSQLAPNLSLAGIVGSAGEVEERVALSGVTTVMTAPYGLHNNGSQVSAIHTAGATREGRVVSPTSAVGFSVVGLDPVAIPGRFKSRIEAGRKYIEKWDKYHEELDAWKKAQAEGKVTESKPKTEEVENEEAVEDPVTGTWSVRVFGGPLPQEFQGTVAFSLNGNVVEGRIIEPVPPTDVRIVGTLTGTTLAGTIEVDTGGMGTPAWTGELTEPDTMNGTIEVQMFSINFEATRTDKAAVEFQVLRGRRRTTGEDGRPLPPKVDESLEPIRAWLENRIPALVSASSTQEIDAVIKYLVDENKLNVVLLNGYNARYRAEQLREKGVGVVNPARLLRMEDRQPYLQADDLQRRGLTVAFQSDAEDGARLLPLMGLRAVERGMDSEAALAALTINPARLYGLSDRIGALAPGCDGDVVIFSGHPFAAASSVQRVFVGGQEVKR